MPTSPVTLVLFGATGDLAVKKIFPALARLFQSGDLHPASRILATSRRTWNTADFHAFLRESAHAYETAFMDRIEYVAADFDLKRGYANLRAAINAEAGKDLLIYLSLAPVFFEDIIGDLKREAILSCGVGKLLLEKPFGTDAHSAARLNDLLDSFLDPAQVYRIDHYLGKATMQAIMRTHEQSADLRFVLSNETVASVTVELLETKGIDGRASYDLVGAFRDIGQNHMLEMLAVTFAEYPAYARATAWHDARACVIESLRMPRREKNLVRAGQYAEYRSERGVRLNSQTETAFSIATVFDTGELRGIPVTLRGGKRMDRSYAGITIEFKAITGFPHTLTFELQPEARAILSFLDGNIETISLHTGRDAYEHVLMDAMGGALRHFVGAHETLAAWRYTDRLLHCLRHAPLETYSEHMPFLKSKEDA